jgi:hypothetical protein
MTPQELSVLRLVFCAPVAVGNCEPEMSELAALGYVEQFTESVGLDDRPTWRITAAGEAAIRAQGE